MKTQLMTLAMMMLFSITSFATVYHVSTEGNDATNDGLTEATAFASLNKAFTQTFVDDDSVLIYDGVYTLDSSLVWDMAINIVGNSGHPNNVIVQAAPTFDPEIENFSCFINNQTSGDPSIIRYITIRHGNAGASSGNEDGGGVRNNHKMKIYGSIIESCGGHRGGGIYSKNSIWMWNTIIRNNVCNNMGGGFFADAFMLTSVSGFFKCSLIGNHAGYGQGAGNSSLRGGALMVQSNSTTDGSPGSMTLNFKNSTIAYNTVQGKGAGAAMRILNVNKGNSTTTATLENSTLVRNYSTNNFKGTGLFIPDGNNDVTVNNCIILENYLGVAKDTVDISGNDGKYITIKGTNNIVGTFPDDLALKDDISYVEFTTLNDNVFGKNPDVRLPDTVTYYVVENAITLVPDAGSIAIDSGQNIMSEDNRDYIRDEMSDIGAAEFIKMTDVTIAMQAEDTNNRTAQFSNTFTPDFVDQDSIVWSLEDDSDASIDANGLVTFTGLSPVTVKVIATAHDGYGAADTLDHVESVSTFLNTEMTNVRPFEVLAQNVKVNVSGALSVTSLSGQIISVQDVSKDAVFSLDNLDKGMYIISLYSNKKMTVEKVVIY